MNQRQYSFWFRYPQFIDFFNGICFIAKHEHFHYCHCCIWKVNVYRGFANPFTVPISSAGGPGASGLAGSQRIGKKKQLAKQHSVQLYGGIPEKYRKLLRQARRRRPKRQLSSLMDRRVGGTRRVAKVHTHRVSSGIPPNIAALLRQYRKKQRRARREYQ